MAVGALTEEIAENLEEVAAVTRRIDTRAVGFLLVGVGVGVAVGFYLGYRYNRQKIRAEVLEEAEEQIEKIRVWYQGKAAALEAQDKPPIEELVEEKGYSKPLVTDLTEEEAYKIVPEDMPTIEKLREKYSPERPLPPPVPVNEPPVSEQKSSSSWNYPVELARRNVNAPYVIHQDEFNNDESGYSKVVYTYYAVDDVLVDEDEKPLPHSDVIVGQNNLKFGHGTDDENVVFVRNDTLKLEMEICRLPRSYEEDVMGLERDELS